MSTLRISRRNVWATFLTAVLGGAIAAPALADWGWIDSDLTVNLETSLGSFGGAATHNGTEVFWSGQADGAIGATWTHSAAGWSTECGTPGDPPCPQGPRVGPGVGVGPDGVLLYGGLGGQFGTPAPGFGDTWLLTPGGWVEQCDAATCGPGIRAAVAMAGNGVIALLYGGTGGAPLHDDTWLYDGSSWTQVCGGASPCGPGQLAAAVMAWDGSQFVLFGGTQMLGPGGTPRDDTWTFDVTTMEWTQVCGGASPCGSAPREFPMMATSGAGEAVLLGGFNFGMAQLVYSDAWRWNGTGWAQIDVPWDATPWSMDNPQAGSCVVLPTHIAPRDSGVALIAATFDDGGPGGGPGAGLITMFGEEDPAGGSSANDPCASVTGGSQPVPTLGNWMLVVLSGLLVLGALTTLPGSLRKTP